MSNQPELKSIDFISIAEMMPIAIEISQKGRLIYANPLFCRMFGYEVHDQMTGKLLKDFYEQKDWLLLDQYGDGWAEQKNTSARVRMTAIKKNAEPFDVERRLWTIEYEESPAVLSVILKSHQMKALRDEFLQHQKMETIGMLTVGIAHDFNNILAVIMGNAEWANLFVASEKSEVRLGIENIIKACHRAKDLTGQLLQFYRGSQQEIKTTNIKLIVEETINLIKAVFPSTIHIHQNISIEQDHIMADATQIHQVLMNMYTNAFHAMNEKGDVLDISLENEHFTFENLRGGIKPGRYAKITVTDNGHGMTQEVMAKIFEPYFTTKEEGSGSGLGLSVSRDIVNSYGGAIDVSSEVGKGSSFYIYLPSTNSSEILKENVALPFAKGSGRILFVDDESLIIDIGKRMIEHLGYEVTTKKCGFEALEIFRKFPDTFDLVITDMTMPDMSGNVLAEQILQIRQDIPIFISTGNRDLLPESEFNRLGIKCVLDKPLTMVELANAIDQFLCKKHINNG